MKVSYNKLWKILIDKNMKKMDLLEAVEMSPNTLAKLGRNEDVSMDVLKRICEYLECDIGDIMENIETQRDLLGLPEYVFPAAMLVFGYPTKQQRERPKPQRAEMRYIVHENRYRRMDGAELREMFESKAPDGKYAEWMAAFCRRKYNSGFAREMSRSVGEYLKQFRE